MPMTPSKHRSLSQMYNELQALATEQKADYNIARTMIAELKTDLDLLRGQVMNMAFWKADIAEGTNANTLQVATAFDYTVANVLYTKAITDNIAMTAAAEQAISTYCIYLCSIDSSGAVTVTKGSEVATDISVLPAVPASECAFAAFKIATDGSTTFTSGTTDLGAAGITETYYDLSFVNSGASMPTAIAAADPTAVAAGVPDLIVV